MFYPVGISLFYLSLQPSDNVKVIILSIAITSEYYTKVYLKESLHILLMKIVFFEINHLHSLGIEKLLQKEKKYKK